MAISRLDDAMLGYAGFLRRLAPDESARTGAGNRSNVAGPIAAPHR
jgi:hypothetical protein